MRSGKYSILNKKYASKLKSFTAYLEKNRYRNNTIRQFINYTAYFLEWLEEETITEGQFTYSDALSYITACKNEPDSITLINRKIASIRTYYKYLQFIDTTNHNPTEGLYLKGKRKTIPANLLNKEELDSLYESYPSKAGQVPEEDPRAKRNKVMLGLVIYQALTTGELSKLEPIHLNLKNGKIEIPGSSQATGRILDLEPKQIMQLHEYLQETRPKLQELAKVHLRQENQEINNRLFFGSNGSLNIKSPVKGLVMSLRKINPKVKDLQQIRQSVIAYWIKIKDLRRVQYMAGHKYISTTERYQVGKLEDLEEALKKYHPLK